MKDTKKLLQNYSKQLDPTKVQKDKVHARVFAQTEQSSKFIFYQGFMKIFESRALQLSLVVFGVFLFIAIPLGVLGVKNLQDNPDSADKAAPSGRNTETYAEPNAISPEVFEDHDTIDEFVEKDALTLEPYPGDYGGGYYDYYPEAEISEDVQTSQSERAIEQDAEFTLETENISEDFASIKDLAQSHNGYIVSSNYVSGDDAEANVKMRVPADRFQDVLNKIREMDLEIKSEDISTIDRQNELTEYTQISQSLEEEIKEKELELENLKDQENPDQEEINVLEYEIEFLKEDLERTKGQVQEIDKETLFSTIEVNLEEKSGLDLGNSWSDVASTFEFMLIFWGQVIAVFFVPVLLSLIVFLIVKRYYFKK
jgi:hypothetical protein